MDETPTNTPLNWALIGCGGIGRAQMRWAADTPDIKTRAFCDINKEAARTLSETHADSYHTTSPAKIFADPQIDIVSIATTHDTHKDLALAAFAAGKHVFLEKPMAMNTDDCLAIIRAHKEAGTQLMLDFSIRFSQAAQSIKERLGPLKASHVQCTQSAADLSTWRWHPTLGGGPLYDVGVHALRASGMRGVHLRRRRGPGARIGKLGRLGAFAVLGRITTGVAVSFLFGHRVSCAATGRPTACSRRVQARAWAAWA